jgi:hypothetical protein
VAYEGAKMSQQSLTQSSETTPSLADESRRISTKADLLSLLVSKGYDPVSYNGMGLKSGFVAKTESATILQAVSDNLSSHGVLNRIAPYPLWEGEPRNAVLIESAQGTQDKRAPALNRLAAWVKSYRAESELFFDPASDFYSRAKGAGGIFGICLPLSLALEPSKLRHPYDPTLGHELIHFKIDTKFDAGCPTVYKVACTSSSPFPDGPATNTSEFLAHRFNLRHALHRLEKVSSEAHAAVQAFSEAQVATASELLYLGNLAKKMTQFLDSFVKEMITPAGHVKLEGQPFAGCARVSLAISSETGQEQMAIWTRATSQTEAHAAVYSYMERLHTLSSAISEEIFQSFIPPLLESQLCLFMQSHLGLPSENDGQSSASFCDDRSMISTLLSSGKSVLNIYGANDLTLEKLKREPAPIFTEVRKALCG